MVNMNISLPEIMKDWIDGQTDTGLYADASDYIRDLIRQDQHRAMQIARMQIRVDQGLQSGESDETMADILESMTASR